MQRVDGGSGFALGEQHGSLRVRGDRPEQRRPEIGGDLRQLIGSEACRIDVTGGQHDLHVCGQHHGPRARIPRIVHRAADRHICRIDPTLRQSQQRQPGLRCVPPLAGLAVRLLGLRELPAQPVKLSLLIERHAERRLAQRVGEPFAGPPYLVHGVRPRAAQLHDLRPMHQALPAEKHQIPGYGGRAFR